jgi:hypothetical protein
MVGTGRKPGSCRASSGALAAPCGPWMCDLTPGLDLCEG